MARKVVVDPRLAKMKMTFPAPTNKPQLIPTSPVSDRARTIRCGFGLRTDKTVKGEGEIQVGLNAISERKDCDLEFMQFVTPTRSERVFLGHRNDIGSITLNWAPHISARQWLDGNVDATETTLVPRHFPFMSDKPHDGRATQHGHFKNSMDDNPGTGMSEFIVDERPERDMGLNGERYFLWRVSSVDNFLTVLVFIHPTGDREAVAYKRWTVEQTLRLRWTSGVPQVITCNGRMNPGNVIQDPDALKDITPIVVNAKGPLINAVANPKLVASVAIPDPEQSRFFPIWPPDVDDGFWSGD